MKLLRLIMIATFLGMTWGVAWGIDTAPAMAGNPAAGKKVYNKCKACHSFAAGKKKVGPSLHGLFGRTAGTLEGFKYSKDMKAAGSKGLVWSEENFVVYIKKPKPFVGSFIGKKKARTKMVFPGLKKQKDRDNLLAYLKEATK